MAEKTALEKEMEALMSGAGALSVDTKATQKNITKARRKSKDLEASLGDMAAVLNASNATQSFQAVMGARVRRKSADYSTDELKVAFDSVDLDKSGSIDKSELKKVRCQDQQASAIGGAAVWTGAVETTHALRPSASG